MSKVSYKARFNFCSGFHKKLPRLIHISILLSKLCFILIFSSWFRDKNNIRSAMAMPLAVESVSFVCLETKTIQRLSVPIFQIYFNLPPLKLMLSLSWLFSFLTIKRRIVQTSVSCFRLVTPLSNDFGRLNVF